VDIDWLTAFIDLPSARFEQGTRFWEEVTNSHRSQLRGDVGEFATLIPRHGDPFVRVQRTSGELGGVHLDIHVPSISGAVRAAVEHGAAIVSYNDYAVMTSPAGFTFRLVSHRGESVVPDQLDVPAPNALDQVSIDIPAAAFDRETSFWAALTGWELSAGALDEFAYLVRPETMPLRLLLQRLAEDDGRITARAHLDLACGTQRNPTTGTLDL
jgi:hypothetical protein